MINVLIVSWRVSYGHLMLIIILVSSLGIIIFCLFGLEKINYQVWPIVSQLFCLFFSSFSPLSSSLPIPSLTFYKGIWNCFQNTWLRRTVERHPKRNQRGYLLTIFKIVSFSFSSSPPPLPLPSPLPLFFFFWSIKRSRNSRLTGGGGFGITPSQSNSSIPRSAGAIEEESVEMSSVSR